MHDPIGTDKEGNEITLIDILGSEADDVIKEVDLKIEKSKIYRNLDILDDREKEVVVGRFGLDTGREERTQREIAKDLGISRSYVPVKPYFFQNKFTSFFRFNQASALPLYWESARRNNTFFY